MTLRVSGHANREVMCHVLCQSRPAEPVRIPVHRPRRSKLYIACSDFFQKSERVHVAVPPFPQKVTLGSPARPKTPSRRLPVATNLLRDAPKAHGIFFVPGRQKNEILSRNVTLNSLQDLMAVLQQIVEEGEAAP